MNERDAIIARLAALEVLTGSCFTFLLASAGNDPDLSKAKAILDVVRQTGEEGLSHLPDELRKEALAVLSHQINQVMTNLAALRGTVGTPLQ